MSSVTQAVQDESYYDNKVHRIYELANHPTNHAILDRFFTELRNFARFNKASINDLDFSPNSGVWISLTTIIHEIDWIEADDWQAVEDIPMSAKKYSEWTAIICRGAETYAYTLGVPLRFVRIADFHWISHDRFIITYSEEH